MAKRKQSLLADARDTTLMTQPEFAELVGVSVPTLVRLERHPEKLTLERARVIYELLPDDGKAIMDQLIDCEIFLPKMQH